MIKIVEVAISRYRSILSLDLPIMEDNNLVALCGKNNVGKTNTLRALKLFFKPEEFDASMDIPKIKHATGGQSVYPKIELFFFDSVEKCYYSISRDMKEYSIDNNGLAGFSYSISGKRKTNKTKMSVEDLEKFLKKIEFVYIESINVFMPELISNLTEGMIDVQYNKARFSESKKNLKESYEAYIDGLQEILNSFSDEISDVFKSFQEGWNVRFNVPKKSDSFRELISDDVTLLLNDNGSEGVLEKGAGLQRLTTILLSFEMLKRMNRSKQVIVCIDEPDVYLHEGLQRKLKDFFDEKSASMQLFFTTHSKIFINPYNMKNVFLLDAKNYEQFSVRKQKNIHVTETYLIDIKEEEGYRKICNHLGIEQLEYELLQPNNILVEGNCDKKYLIELGNYFGFKVPNIESLNGADNALKFLDFYDSYYSNNVSSYKPKVKVLFDNDSKGREIYQKVIAKKYVHLEVEAALLSNYLNTADKNIVNNITNNEIEDFLYPEVICTLINMLLSKRGMKKISEAKVCKAIKTKSFRDKGILELCEHEKNISNPDNGAEISFVSSGAATNRVKEGLAGLFNIQANPSMLNLLSECDKKYPLVKAELERLFCFSTNDTSAL